MKLKSIRLHDSVQLPEGEAQVFLLQNTNRMEVKVTNYGGIIMSVISPDRNGKLENIVLGYDHVRDYCTENYRSENPYLGAIVGRNAGIISAAKFSIDTDEYILNKNLGSHNLHGGNTGFDKILWQYEITETEGFPALRLWHISDDGAEGFPGKLTVSVTYQLTDANDLKIFYQARSDRKTIVNLTSHSYFNLSGGAHEDILHHALFVNASRYIEADQELIPTGKIKDVKDTPLDFRSSTCIGERIEEDFDQLRYGMGYDVSFILDRPASHLPTLAASIFHLSSGRYLEVFTTQPVLHLYTANVLGNVINNDFRPRQAVCLEAQHYPDAPNHPEFPSSVISADEVYTHTTVYRFSVK